MEFNFRRSSASDTTTTDGNGPHLGSFLQLWFQQPPSLRTAEGDDVTGQVLVGGDSTLKAAIVSTRKAKHLIVVRYMKDLPPSACHPINVDVKLLKTLSPFSILGHFTRVGQMNWVGAGCGLIPNMILFFNCFYKIVL